MGKAILSLGTEELKFPLLCLWMTCNPLSILPSRQTCGQAFAVAVVVGADAVGAFSEICRGDVEGLLAHGTDHDREQLTCAALQVAQ